MMYFHGRFSGMWVLAAAMVTLLAGRAWAEEPLPPRVAQSVAAFEQKSKAQLGVCAVSIADKRELLAQRGDQLFMPASNMKVLTSCFALARLGGDFKFTTTIYTSGNDVLVKGDFDPTMGDPVVAQSAGKTIYAEMDLWAKAVKKRLDGKPAGNVILIARGGNYRHEDWPRDQYHRWYCAPIAELNFNNNCYDVRFGMKDGQLCPLVSPESRFIKVVNSVKAGGRAWSLHERPGKGNDTQVVVAGTAGVNKGDPVSVAADNPPMLFGRALAERLELAGVSVEGDILADALDQAALDKAKPLIQTTTPLSVVMGRADKRSVNMIAEGMFLRAGDGTFAGSAKIETKTLEEIYGLDPKSFSISDGSGFSRKDLVSPRAMVKLLSVVLDRRDAKVLLDSLPVSGVDGTLTKRFKQAPYRGRILGKTGYIAGVSCLSGYVLNKDGKPAIAYSVMVNKCADLAGAKQTEEMVCKSLVDWLDGQAKTADKAK